MLRIYAKKHRAYNPKKGLTQSRQERKGKASLSLLEPNTHNNHRSIIKITAALEKKHFEQGKAREVPNSVTIVLETLLQPTA